MKKNVSCQDDAISEIIHSGETSHRSGHFNYSRRVELVQKASTMMKIIVLVLVSISFIGAEHEKKKTCLHNLQINGTNLILSHRKQLLVVGIVNYAKESARFQANRFNDLYRELDRHRIRDSLVRLVLINEQEGTKYFNNAHVDKIRLFHDNPKDKLVKKLENYGKTMNTLVFGRCGYLIYSQRAPNSDLTQGTHFQDLLRVITTAVKNKRRCQNLCS